ncbi:MAG: AMP-binding protein [Bacteroidia bacterium]|nr:AMP-binding protein [Bacteroidia bacterium]
MKELTENLRTHLDYFYQWEREKPDAVFLRQPFGERWQTLTYKEAGLEARKMAAALQNLGLKKGEHIGIFSKNCYHWVLADLAIMMGGFVSTPFYPNLSSKQSEVVLERSDARLVFVGKLDSWDALDQAIPEDLPIIKFPHYEGNARVSRGMDWDELVENQMSLQGEPLPELSDTWTILFTSGTTGIPKGVIHDYENAAMVIRSEELIDNLKTGELEQTSFFSFLPLNHIAERVAVEVAALMSGGKISFGESLDTFAKNLQDTQPTLFFAVPRIWTKFYMAILAKIPQKRLNFLLGIPGLSGLLKKRLKKALGLSNTTMVMTGASMTPEPLKQWYRKLDINLREIYGMTECCGGFSLMPADRHQPNTVGKVLPFCEGKIDEETGEILMKLPWVMKGYYKDPELSQEVLKNGWLHSGDKGEFDKDGFLKVIGRVKDAFKTTKGVFVVPGSLEEKFMDSDIIEQVCVVGIGISQPVALVNLSEDAVKMPRESIERNLVQQLSQVNDSAANHETVSTMIITKEAWGIDNHLLTPTLKLRRGAIDERYRERFQEWHLSDQDIIWED